MGLLLIVPLISIRRQLTRSRLAYASGGYTPFVVTVRQLLNKMNNEVYNMKTIMDTITK